ncbi:hypothetical protein [Sphingomonas jatrophae]|uniref:Uncharacterized protein n=1 Tax=Sphingomonas jatrophae TaxID=1166337 RepID=A0A1I6K083_9SPHN|nr:hypothetical protein [Sphingomonas jatrophae]SFR84649.1 hypothetical protein SAMN05192580_1161 [Sphingomonas jatrophae]
MRWSTVVYTLFCMAVVTLHIARTFAGYTVPGDRPTGTYVGGVSSGPHHK